MKGILHGLNPKVEWGRSAATPLSRSTSHAGEGA